VGGLVAGTLEVMAEQCTGRGVRGVVAAAAPLAAALGAEALRAGGNAYDAAVTAALAETVLLPPKCGLAGDLVALRVVPAAREPEALLAIGGAPAGLEAAGRDGLPVTGPLSVGVPAAPAGYAALAEQGTFTLDRLVAPAAALARDGFAWAQICTSLAEESRDLLGTHNPSGTAYLPGGEPIAPGTVVRLPGLADALEAFAAHGAELLRGPVGDAVVDAVRRRGGVLTRDDFAFAAAEWATAAEGVAGGRRVWTTPAPTHGPSLLEAVRDAAAGDDAGVVWDRVLAAIAGRRDTLADPGGTSMVSAADAAGNAVVVIHSNSFPRFGSGIVVEPYGLVLNNRAGRGFIAEPGHPNRPVAGRRPDTTLHAWAWGDEGGRVALLGGTPGGENQLPWNAQALAQLIAGETRPGLLVAAPRWEWLPDDDGARVEEGFGPADVEALRARASRVVPVPRWGLASAQQVVARPVDRAALVAAVDPRTGGAVVAV
jgi:gamma-glutamyltranspeptidase / glutathione hydrolase